MTHLKRSKSKPKFDFTAIGTSWQIDIAEYIGSDVAEDLLADIKSYIADFDKNYSRFRADSLVTLMSNNIGQYNLPEDAQPMLDLYKDLYSITNGLLTPLIGQVMVDTGYDANYSLIEQKPVVPPKWEDVLEYNYPKLNILKPALLDFGAAGKGYLVDLVAGIIRKYNITSFTVDAGGDIYYQNAHNKTLDVGLEHPVNKDEVVGVAQILNKSICGSAGNRRKWGKYMHIINPDTLESPRGVLATWVVAKSTMQADALATCLFFCSAEKLRTHYTFEYALINSDLSFQRSENFPAKFF